MNALRRWIPTWTLGWLLMNGIQPHAEPLAGLAGSEPSAPIQSAVERAVKRTVEQFKGQGLRPDQLAVSVVEITDPLKPVFGHHRGEELIYPASVVKLFYLAAAHRWLEDGRIEDTAELRRALKDMIVESNNDATHYVLDVLTGTTSGPELSDSELADWVDRRNAVNRYFRSLGYAGINANKKPWCEGPYGRETQAIAKFAPGRNLLTTDATARLLTEMVTDRMVTADRCRAMRDLLRRDVEGPVKDPEGEGDGFTGLAVREFGPKGVKLWSKAGWTSQTRHDAAYLELPDGRRWVVVVFTTEHAGERRILSTLAASVLGWPTH